LQYSEGSLSVAQVTKTGVAELAVAVQQRSKMGNLK